MLWAADNILWYEDVDATYAALVKAAYIIQEENEQLDVSTTAQRVGMDRSMAGQIRLLNRLVISCAWSLFPEEGDEDYDPSISEGQAAGAIAEGLMRHAREI